MSLQRAGKFTRTRRHRCHRGRRRHRRRSGRRSSRWRDWRRGRIRRFGQRSHGAGELTRLLHRWRRRRNRGRCGNHRRRRAGGTGRRQLHRRQQLSELTGLVRRFVRRFGRDIRRWQRRLWNDRRRRRWWFGRLLLGQEVTSERAGRAIGFRRRGFHCVGRRLLGRCRLRRWNRNGRQRLPRTERCHKGAGEVPRFLNGSRDRRGCWSGRRSRWHLRSDERAGKFAGPPGCRLRRRWRRRGDSGGDRRHHCRGLRRWNEGAGKLARLNH